MAIEKIITEWKNRKFKPVYWLEGDEEFFMDKVMQYAEHSILPESEAEFNLSVFYGRDANWADIINACRRYPMFAERQVVLLKEAQQMRDVEKLEPYIENPLPSTIFVVSYKNKKVDGRTKFAKTLKEKAVYINTKKLAEYQLPDWTLQLIQSKGLTISQKGIALLVDHLGNDLTRISNEIDKLSLNLGSRKNITEDDIEQFVGVSKDFNVFELQSAIGRKDIAGAIRIIQYFEANPKAAPIQMVLPSLYSFFSKVFMVHGSGSMEQGVVATATGIQPFLLKEPLAAARLYNYAEVEKALLLLHSYNLRSVGVNDAGTEDGSLLKELVIKMVG